MDPGVGMAGVEAERLAVICLGLKLPAGPTAFHALIEQVPRPGAALAFRLRLLALTGRPRRVPEEIGTPICRSVLSTSLATRWMP